MSISPSFLIKTVTRLIVGQSLLAKRTKTNSEKLLASPVLIPFSMSLLTFYMCCSPELPAVLSFLHNYQRICLATSLMKARIFAFYR